MAETLKRLQKCPLLLLPRKCPLLPKPSVASLSKTDHRHTQVQSDETWFSTTRFEQRRRRRCVPHTYSRPRPPALGLRRQVASLMPSLYPACLVCSNPCALNPNPYKPRTDKPNEPHLLHADDQYATLQVPAAGRPQRAQLRRRCCPVHDSGRRLRCYCEDGSGYEARPCTWRHPLAVTEGLRRAQRRDDVQYEGQQARHERVQQEFAES